MNTDDIFPRKTIVYFYKNEVSRAEAVRQMQEQMPSATIIGISGADEFRSVLGRTGKIDVLVSNLGIDSDDREQLKIMYATMGIQNKVGAVILRTADITLKDRVIKPNSPADRLVIPVTVGITIDQLVKAIRERFTNPPMRS